MEVEKISSSRNKKRSAVRIFILGLDGLEYNFVEKWNLKNLKQKEYGRVKVPIDKYSGVPLSPEVWAAFLTGKYPSRYMGFKREPKIDFILRVLKIMRRYLPLSLGLGKRIRVRASAKFPDLKEKTFLDLTCSKEINAPYYSHDNKTFKITQQFDAGNLTLKEAINETLKLYSYWKERILEEGKNLENFDVVFAYMHFPDTIHHLLFIRPQRIRRFYIDLDNYVSVLKRSIETSLFLIVSDHGFDLKAKSHSRYGFYSSNIHLESKPKDITDFYHLILKWTSTSHLSEME